MKQTQTWEIAAIVVFVGATDFFINLNRLHGLKTRKMVMVMVIFHHSLLPV